MTQMVNMHDAKSRLSSLIASVENGEEVIIARAGTPVAKIVSYAEPAHPDRFGSLKDIVPYISLDAWEGSDRDMEDVWKLRGENL